MREITRLDEILAYTDAVGEIFLAMDRDWRVTAVNRPCEVWTGRRRHDLVGRSLWDLAPKLVGTPVEQQMRRAMQSRERSEFEVPSTWFPGRRLRAVLMPAAGGLGMAVREVTEREEIRDEWRRSEERFRSLVAATGSVVWSAPASGVFGTEQPEWSAFTGQTFDQLAGSGWLDAVHPDDRSDAEAAWREAVEARMPLRSEHRLRRHDGTYRPMLVRAVPIHAPDGAVLEWIGVHTDVSDLKRVEDALRESETRFRVLADTMPQIVWSTRADGYHDYYNRRWYEFTGRLPEESEGTGWNPTLHPDDRERAWNAWQHALRTGDPYEIEYRFRAADGTYRWFLGRALPMRDSAGRVIRWFGTCTDIHAAKETERALQEALEAKEILLREVNHRVKNSLQVVTSLLALQASQTGDSGLRRSIQEARSRIAVVAQVHQRLYTTGRHDRVDLAAFLEELAGDTVGVLDVDGRITLDLDCGPGIELGLDKAVPLALVVSELITNSLKYAFPEGREGRITIRVLRLDGNGLCIVIADDGRGLPEDFEPARSNGLGMRIVTALARQIRARLEIAPTAPGTAFQIILPTSE